MIMPTKDDMIRKRDWAKEKTLEAIKNDNFLEAKKIFKHIGTV